MLIAFLMGIVGLTNIWLLAGVVQIHTSTGAGSAQSDFEVFIDLFRFGIPAILLCVIVMVGMFISDKELNSKEIAKKPRFLYFLINALIPAAIYILI